MLPLAHTYVSTKATGKTTPLLIFGSILPDIATVSSQHFDRDKIHNSPRELFEFIKSNYPDLLDLALGVRLHSQIDKGADFYTDDWDIGYAYLNGKNISNDVADMLGLPNGKISAVLAHNFIELAIDLHLYQNQIEIWNTYKRGLEEITKNFSEISQCLGSYLELDANIIIQELNGLIIFYSPDKFISKESAITKGTLPLIKLRLNKDVSKEKALAILNKALEITKSTYQQFLDNTVTEVRKNILQGVSS